VHLAATDHMPWAGLQGEAVRGHEFHYSSLDGLPADTRYAWRITRGHGIDGRHDGVVQNNLLATYAHLRSVAGTDWARHFVDFVRARRSLCARVEQPERLAA
jgi:cobyrinic acid a,c-diamide synthase